jgi:hypothetical protein
MAAAALVYNIATMQPRSLEDEHQRHRTQRKKFVNGGTNKRARAIRGNHRDEKIVSRLASSRCARSPLRGARNSKEPS